jgi:hypothetical protein
MLPGLDHAEVIVLFAAFTGTGLASPPYASAIILSLSFGSLNYWVFFFHHPFFFLLNGFVPSSYYVSSY